MPADNGDWVVLFADDQIPWPNDADNDATFEAIREVKDVTREQFDEDRAWFEGLLRDLRIEGIELHAANTYAEASAAIETLAFDVAIIDRSWNGDGALDVARRSGVGRTLVRKARRTRPRAGVICLSQDFRSDPRLMLDACRDGVLPLPKAYNEGDSAVLIGAIHYLAERDKLVADAELATTSQADEAWAKLQRRSEGRLEQEERWLKRIRAVTMAVMLVAVVVVVAAAWSLMIGDETAGRALMSLVGGGLLAQTGLLGWLWMVGTRQQEIVRGTLDDMRKLAAGPTGHERIDAILAIEGKWWQDNTAVRGGSALSLIEIRSAKDGQGVFMTGQSWNAEGTKVATWKSGAVEVDPREHEIALFYAWRGRHPKRPDGGTFTGTGELTFTRDEGGVDRADGWFTATNHQRLDQTEFEQSVYTRVTDEELERLAGPDHATLIRDKLAAGGETA